MDNNVEEKLSPAGEGGDAVMLSEDRNNKKEKQGTNRDPRKVAQLTSGRCKSMVVVRECRLRPQGRSLKASPCHSRIIAIATATDGRGSIITNGPGRPSTPASGTIIHVPCR